MLDFMKRRAAKAHTPPGTLHYFGPERDFTPSIRLISYNAEKVREHDLDPGAGAPELAEDLTHLINVIGVHDKKLIAAVGEWFGVHPLTLEDVMNTDIRPKAEEIGGFAFMVLKAVETSEQGRAVEEQIAVLHMRNVVIVFQESRQDLLAGLTERIRKGRGRIRGAGAEYLVAVVFDIAADSFFPAMADVGERVEMLEAEIVENPDKDAVARIHRLKREVMELRNTLIPMREIVSRLIRGETGSVSPETEPFLRDVQDHLLQATDTVNSLTDLLLGLMDLHVSLSGLRMNEVMKVLTIIATIFIPLTFIAGIYGMNFEYMPELSWHYGYFLVVVLMAAVAWIMIRYFKRKGWL